MFAGGLRSTAVAVALTFLTVTATQACTTAPGGPPARNSTSAPNAPPSAIRPRAGPVANISGGCAGSSAEVEEAAARPGYVYAEWIGCGGIGFARSADSGRHFGPAMTVPGSTGASWDPAITVAADGTVYAAFMHAGGTSGRSMYPVVAVSRNHGATFTQVDNDFPPAPGNWGDRVFIAAGPRNQLFLTWDYGPSAAQVKTLCARGGSCSFTKGDFNAVIQASGNGGATWGPITHLQPGFPRGGGYGAPLPGNCGPARARCRWLNGGSTATSAPTPRATSTSPGTPRPPPAIPAGSPTPATAAAPGLRRSGSPRTPATRRTSWSRAAASRESPTSPGRPVRPSRATPPTCARSRSSAAG